ncbi:hypothetical protein C1645_785219 [Glomus cerebriforme]|uniref:Uncharacterized protein n=1 Tax=Glomus cerebriforme TaxID=658196 RepID=A0A397SIC1_9GLOM|nr:hypothetical protein C1645_785219 [Glomus cerebriforme]
MFQLILTSNYSYILFLGYAVFLFQFSGYFFIQLLHSLFLILIFFHTYKLSPIVLFLAFSLFLLIEISFSMISLVFINSLFIHLFNFSCCFLIIIQIVYLCYP